MENVAAFNKLNTIKKLISLMENQPEDVLVNVVGALGACAQTGTVSFIFEICYFFKSNVPNIIIIS